MGVYWYGRSLILEGAKSLYIRNSSSIVHPLIDPQALQSGDEVVDTSVEMHNEREVEEELEDAVEVW